MSEQDTTNMRLDNEITVNGVTYPSGSNVKVPKNQADDLARMDHDFNEYEKGLTKKRTYNQQIRGAQ